MHILGLATMTDSAAALLEDGRVVAAAEEERFSRHKHDGGFPYRAIRYVLASRGLTLADLDHVAVYWDPLRLGHRLRYVVGTGLRDPALFATKVRRGLSVWGGTAGTDSGWGSLLATRHKLAAHFGRVPRSIRYLDHHRCHMATAHFGSGFDRGAVLILDGAGEAACTTWGSGTDARLSILDQHLLPHSLGHYYSAVTGWLGFRMLDGESKAMGLSSYGDRSGSAWIREHFLISPGPGRYRLNTPVLDYHRALRGEFDGPFTRHFGPPRPSGNGAPFEDRHRDVAASSQAAFEEVLLDMAWTLRRATGMSRLSLAGGCALNCVANGRILREGIFEEIYVPPVPHDAGGAIGAAMLRYVELTGRRPEPLAHAQLGPSFDDAAIARAIAERADVAGERLDEALLLNRAAATIADGHVIGWFQGAMEHGPRALGNRSVLADPRVEGIRETLNARVKRREPFRPFAPSVKAERAGEYFELGQAAPFMSIAVPVRPAMRAKIPAVTHVDGTSRPQTVDRHSNPRYWALIDRFEALSGVPLVLNTSFNVQEPIVCSPDDALRTFESSRLDALAIGDWWVTRREAR